MTASEEVRARWRDLFRRREFGAIFVATVFSVAGDQLARVALSVLVFDRTASAGLTALTYALTYVPELAFGPLLSGFADRYPRRRVMVVTDLGRAALVAAMAIPGLSLVTLATLLVGVQALSAPFNAARAASLAVVLRGDEYVLGKAANDMVVQFSQVLGFGTGGLLVAGLGTSTGLLVDSGTFAASAVLIVVGLRARPAPSNGSARTDVGRWWGDLVAGTALVVRTPRLRWLVALACIAGFYITVEGVAVPYADQIDGGPGAAGLLLAASPAGTVLGMWLITRCSPDLRLRLIGPLAVCACLPLVFCATHPGLTATAVLWTLSGMASAYHLPASAEFVRAVPDHRRGQAYGVATTALRTSQGAGILGAGVLADVMTPASAIALLGAIGALLAIGCARAWAGAHRMPTRTIVRPRPGQELA